MKRQREREEANNPIIIDGVLQKRTDLRKDGKTMHWNYGREIRNHYDTNAKHRKIGIWFFVLFLVGLVIFIMVKRQVIEARRKEMLARGRQRRQALNLNNERNKSIAVER